MHKNFLIFFHHRAPREAKNICSVYLKSADLMLYTANPVISRGIEKMVNKTAIFIPVSDKIPKREGPIMAPNLPTPIEKPIPVFRISEGYTREIAAYNPLNPP